ncbi:Vi polysaccharide biosynthesis protein VipA/TviB [Tenacibaculum sp. 190130A14a]|uniref:Vi polysaccharide biosynthesis protein VipA/TviB n=1 Tax=Tenacibaculum polynesiense TaxID=3137857 RepID=A0ABP1F1C4_9FLAO
MNDVKIAVIGLGYVGLPLARLFATKYAVVGFDINEERVSQLNKGYDATFEIEKEELHVVLKKQNTNQNGLFCSSLLDDIRDCTIYIVTVPTPVDKNNRAVLDPLIDASKLVGAVLSSNDIVIYESTVYPGVTEEECVPVLESTSELKFNKDFFVGYSPERINPGDKKNTLESILKVTSGSTEEVANMVDNLYGSIIKAGTHKVSSIKVAEASKVIENSQRDINIAFVNELAKIFGFMNIDTQEVLEAAGTKWNFLPFKPGLVGGHCIGVDPYYLVQRAEELGYHPGVILAGRRLNDSMGDYVASQVIKLMIERDLKIKNAKVLILGITFKENCPDVRNTKVIDVIHSLKEYGTNVFVYDPWASKEEVEKEYNLELIDKLEENYYNAIVLVVAHDEFKKLNIESLKAKEAIVYDVKGLLPREMVDKSL